MTTLYDLIDSKPGHIRLGQHFVNMCIKDDGSPVIITLYQQRDNAKAMLVMLNLIEHYNWDINDIPVIGSYTK